jgi:hypothetical protein
MTFPPIEEILAQLHNNIIPAAGCAAVVMCTFLLFGRRFAALGSAVAVVLAFMTCNFTLANVGYEDKATWENTARLVPWAPGENAAGWHWLPRGGLLLVVVGVGSRWLGLVAKRMLSANLWWGASLLVWAPRIAAAVIVAGWFASGHANKEDSTLMPIVAAVMVLSWVALDGVARGIPMPEEDFRYGYGYEPESAGRMDTPYGAEVTLYLSAALLAAATILILTHTARFMELAVVLGMAMFGIAVAAIVGRADASGAIPAAVAFLPGLILAARSSLEDNLVPPLCFWLVALAPLALLPFAIPPLSRKHGWFARGFRAVLVLAPLIAAVVLAAQHETIAW